MLDPLTRQKRRSQAREAIERKVAERTEDQIWSESDGPFVKLTGGLASLYLFFEYADEATATTDILWFLAAGFFISFAFLMYSGVFGLWKQQGTQKLTQLVYPVAMVGFAIFKSVNATV